MRASEGRREEQPLPPARPGVGSIAGAPGASTRLSHMFATASAASLLRSSTSSHAATSFSIPAPPGAR